MFSDEVAESLEAEVLIEKVDGLIEQLRADADVALQDDDSNVVEPQTENNDPQQSLPVDATTELENSTDVVVSPVEDSAETYLDTPSPVEEDLKLEAPVAEVALNEIPTAVVEEPPEKIELPVAETNVVSQLSAESVPPLTLWRAARNAVWQGDLDGAVAKYHQLISAQPDNYDAHGEMGNVLLAQSNVTGAIESYVKAARLIYRSGNPKMAFALANVVGKLDNEQGRALYNEFSQRKK